MLSNGHLFMLNAVGKVRKVFQCQVCLVLLFYFSSDFCPRKSSFLLIFALGKVSFPVLGQENLLFRGQKSEEK